MNEVANDLGGNNSIPLLFLKTFPRPEKYASDRGIPSVRASDSQHLKLGYEE
jgi:hypothetical protein